MNRSKSKIWLGCLLAVVISACSHPTEPGLAASFTLNTSGSATESAAANVASGGIRVTGLLTIPDPCYSGAASASRSGSELTLTLSGGTHSSGPCAQVIARLAYDVTVPAGPGVYDLRVVHETVGLTPPPREVLHTTITVQ